MSQSQVFIIERAGKPICWFQTGSQPVVVFTDDAFADLKCAQSTDQATTTGKTD